VSTCYVSGRYDGVFTGGMIEEACPFHNHYESSKHTAEVLVRSRSIAAGDTLSVVDRPDALRRLERAAESVPEGGDSESDPDGPGRRETQPSTARTEE